MLNTEQPKTLREWMLENIEDEDLEAIVEHGCVIGFFGLTYYNETSALYDTYQEEIWDMLAEQAKVFGFDNSVAFIASMNGVKKVGNQTTFANLLVWYAVEELARTILEERKEAAQ